MQKPRIFKTKGKKPRLFLLVNGKRKYIKVDDPNMTEDEIIKFIQSYYKIKKKSKTKTMKTIKAQKSNA